MSYYGHEPEGPEVDPSEVLDVLFGRSDEDSLGRTYYDLMNDTEMSDYFDHLAFHHETEKKFFRVIGENWSKFPEDVREVFEKLAIKAAKVEK